eukprot:comp21901_c0_seq1/m.31432 comp21901_c0_seq1/g.31432  ORF comp21901_c0_seq1/g.31432 comp21901_c0_seq1/m.31432 type:complete len:110 (-) comp21901_c0_seq1:453-782(-)
MAKAVKAFLRGQKWEKDELLDVLFWGRQLVGVLLGLAFGFLPMLGAPALLSGLVLLGSYSVLHTGYLDVDEDIYGGAPAGAQEGFANGLGLFMLTWIITYTAVHVDKVL